MVLQYLAIIAYSAAYSFLSVVWSLTQSLIWMIVADGLDWIQSRSFGPLILEWDSFLFGVVFMTVDIHPESIEYHHKMASSGWPSTHARSDSRSSSRSNSQSSSNSSGRRVTFDEQVMVLGRSGAARVQQQHGNGVTPILVSNSSFIPAYPCQDSYVPVITESPTRSTFAFSQELEFLQRNYGYNYSQFNDSPSSSRSSSCRSSICSISSTESDKESATVAKSTAPSSSSTKSNSSRLTSLFHHVRHTQHSPSTLPSPSIDLSTQPSGTHNEKKSKTLVHRIMHPHQHKRELELQQQQQENMRRHSHPYHAPEFLDAMALSMIEHEYQPSEHTRKTFKERIGLKKKSHST
ncbi:hypothetical protein FBU30_009937 [Linnemannia zychae]|nr:hypothetical protein FBU30_009937 [Linnemannia zychae]